MAHVTITIKTDNAAFGGDDYGSELARILHQLAGRIEGTSEGDMDGSSTPLFDANGNRVGEAKFSD